MEVERYEYQFDDNDICIYQAAYSNDEKIFEEFSEIAPDGSPVVKKQIFYLDNGEVLEMTYAYEFDEEGNLMKQTSYQNGAIAEMAIYAYDEDGCHYLFKEFYYDVNGNVASEIHYDSEGNEIYSSGSGGQ